MATSDDYIDAFMGTRAIDVSRAALIVIDMQNATGSRSGALGRRLTAQGSGVGDCRFERIEKLIVPNTHRLLEAFRAAGRRIVYLTIGAALPDASDAPPHMRKLFIETQNYVGSREHEIVESLAPRADEPVVRKTSIGAFASTGLDSLLRAFGCDQLYLVGVSTNMCVETTAREAADRGYLVTLVEDACGSTHADLHENTMRNFRRLFGRVQSTDATLAELGVKAARAARRAGAP